MTTIVPKATASNRPGSQKSIGAAAWRPWACAAALRDQHGDGVDRHNDHGHRDREEHDQPHGLPPCVVLPCEEVHGHGQFRNRRVARLSFKRRACLPHATPAARDVPPTPQPNETFGLALLGLFDLEQAGRLEVEHAGDDHRGEGLAPGVVEHHRVVIGLPGEGDLVLGGGQFLLQGQHVLVGLQVGIGLGHGEKPAQHAGQLAFRAAQGRHGLRIARVLRGLLSGGSRGVAGLDHGLQRFPLVLHVALGRLDQVGDQVVAAFELHVDLRKRIFVAVPQA